MKRTRNEPPDNPLYAAHVPRRGCARPRRVCARPLHGERIAATHGTLALSSSRGASVHGLASPDARAREGIDAGGMLGIDREINERGGLLRTSELYALGYWQSLVQWSKWWGTIIHVCKGWWATKETPPAVIAARRAGGRLACVSAMAHHGEGEGDDLLHVALERSSKHPHDPGVVPHWSRRQLPGNRQAVSLEVAREQAKRCRARASRAS